MRISIAGIGTDVGKTVVSAIFTQALEADYWKPIQTGCKDLETVRSLVTTPKSQFHASSYHLKAPVSPHIAASMEGITIDPEKIILPDTSRPLIIEGTGGIFSPITNCHLPVDLFKPWDCHWFIVSRHYLGSINHTLLTIDALKNRGCAIKGIIFNGPPNLSMEIPILHHANFPLVLHLHPEKEINPTIIKRYAKQWRQQLQALL